MEDQNVKSFDEKVKNVVRRVSLSSIFLQVYSLKNCTFLERERLISHCTNNRVLIRLHEALARINASKWYDLYDNLTMQRCIFGFIY